MLREGHAVVAIEKKKLLRVHLDEARRHADSACRFENTPLAAREIKESLAHMTTAIELLADVLNNRPELY
jgi:hypothetical protein